jgi:hypothetical protein
MSMDSTRYEPFSGKFNIMETTTYETEGRKRKWKKQALSEAG